MELAQSNKISPYIYAGLDKSWQLSYRRNKPTGGYTLNYWIDLACEYYKVLPNDFYSNKRNRKFADARQMAIYLYVTHRNKCNLPRLSYIAIGEKVNRNHATIIHSVKAYESQLFFNKKLGKYVSSILKQAIADCYTEQNEVGKTTYFE